MPFRGAPTLVLIDIQQGFDGPEWGPRNNPHAEENAARLLGFWRQRGLPVIHVQHDSVHPGSPLRPGQPGHDFKEMVRPRTGESVLHKSVNSAFIGTDLETRLRALGAPSVVLCGLTTNHCVSTTARMAGNLGFDTWVVADATAAFSARDLQGAMIGPDVMHQVGLAELNGEFATVKTTADVLAALG